MRWLHMLDEDCSSNLVTAFAWLQVLVCKIHFLGAYRACFFTHDFPKIQQYYKKIKINKCTLLLTHSLVS